METKLIIEAFERVTTSGQLATLATVVEVEGSAYRRPGARMLVTENGNMVGAISGGCLEGDALRKALLVMQQQTNKLVLYDTTEDDDAALGAQLGCNGKVRVLMEVIDPAHYHHPLTLLKRAVAKRQNYVVATLFCLEDDVPKQHGMCFLLEEDGTATTYLDDAVIAKTITDYCKEALSHKRSFVQDFTHNAVRYHSFIEFVARPVCLLVIGAGNDSFPLIAMANVLGWETTVVDGRPTHANANRFQNSCQIMVGAPEEIFNSLTIDDRTASVLMTHNFQYDKKALKALLTTATPYIGVLGPKKKLLRLQTELQDEGISISDKDMARIYGPVGLEIGAETPQEIACSIIAEIQMVLTGASGNSLRLLDVPIHHQTNNSLT